MTLEVSGLNERNSELRISRLAEQIEPSASYHKVCSLLSAPRGVHCPIVCVGGAAGGEGW